MTCIIKTKSNRRLSAKLAAGLAISAVLVLGTFVTSANAEGRRGDAHRGGENRGNVGHPGWGRSYYPAPPVVYGPTYYAPYYPPPPVVYGPGIGINLPGISIGIQ